MGQFQKHFRNSPGGHKPEYNGRGAPDDREEVWIRYSSKGSDEKCQGTSEAHPREQGGEKNAERHAHQSAVYRQDIKEHCCQFRSNRSKEWLQETKRYKSSKSS